MSYYLGVDAGGTKTAFLLADGEGHVLASHRETGCRLLYNTEDELAALLRKGAGAVCEKAHIRAEELAFSAVGISGYGEGADGEEKTLCACEAALGAGRVVCDCDSYIAWAGSLAMKPGINVISGTGAIGYGVNAGGRRARCSGWGSVFDEGSCQWIGVRVVQAYTQQADGRAPVTLLYERFRERFGIHDDTAFIERLNHGFFDDAAQTADLQRLCLQLYEAGDPCAAALYERAARELARTAWAVASRLEMEAGYKVSYSGGLFASGEAILGPMRKAVADLGGTLAAPRYTPDQGAVLMAICAKNMDAKIDGIIFR